MIITCPHCQTRYQVAQEAIGAVGRKVQCAHCSKAWQATPPPVLQVVPPVRSPRDDKMFNEMAEQQMDAALEAEARAVELAEQVIASAHEHKATPANIPQQRVDMALQRKRQRAFSRRQNSLSKSLPMARVRRLMRAMALLLLLGVVCGFYFLRTEIVRQVPDMAGVYEKLGLGVNVVGLDFREVTTLRTLRQGDDVLIVSAQILSASHRTVAVPPVIVTLLAADGTALYQWSVAADVAELEPGDVIGFRTELTGAPGGAENVRLTFASGRAQAQTPTEGQ